MFYCVKPTLVKLLNSFNFWIATGHKGLYLFDKKTERFYATGIKTDLGKNSFRVCGDKLLINTYNDIQIYGIQHKNLVSDVRHINQNIQFLYSYNASQKDTAHKISLTLSVFNTWMPDCSFWASINDSVLHYIPDAGFKSWHTRKYSFHDLGMNDSTDKSMQMTGIRYAPERLLIYARNSLLEYDEKKKAIIFKKEFAANTKQVEKSISSFNDSSFILSGNDNLFVFNEHTKSISRWDMQQPVANINFGYGTPFTDAHGISWLGSNGWGALKCDLLKEKFKNFKTADDNYFTKLNESYDPLSWKIKKIYEYNYNQITQDKEGVYWMNILFNGTNLISYNAATKVIKHWPGLGNNFTFQTSVYNDPQDRLWIYASDAGNRRMIYLIDKNTGRSSKNWQMPVNNFTWDNSYIMQWWQDAQQVFWLATVNGLYRFDFTHNKWNQWLHKKDDKSSISTDWLYTLCADPAEPERFLWLGTNGNGFDKFDMQTGKCIAHFTTIDGLPNNVVYGILPDEAGNLWMSTNKGLTCFNPATKAFRNFSQEDGLAGDEFNHFEFKKLRNGDMLFGGVEGFTVFDPAIVLQKQKPAPVVLTGLSISNKPVYWKQDTSILNAPIDYASKITLLPGQDMFTISFASLEYRSNKKKFYKYKLDGFDKNFTEPSNKNEATYTNLSPGTYTFHVMGTNSDGVWNKKDISMQIDVLPYWYQTWWFKLAIALVLMAAIYFAYRYRLTQALKMEKLRNRIATDLHDEIGSTLSSIALYSESAKMMMNGNVAADSVLSKINASTSEMMEAMSDIVWAVNTKNDGLDNLANRMRSFAVQMAESKNIQLHFTENEDLPSMPLDMEQRKNMYLIFKEAVNNAVKYSGCKNISISFAKENHILKMQVQDDGIGFTNTMNKNNLGGNGMMNMRNRAEQINGKLSIASEIGKGTDITLHVQL